MLLPQVLPQAPPDKILRWKVRHAMTPASKYVTHAQYMLKAYPETAEMKRQQALVGILADLVLAVVFRS